MVELKQLGRYLLHEPLGQGGMAKVYLGEDPLLKRAVALKVIRDEILPQEDMLERFKSEAAIVARLQHPNIVQVFDIGSEEDKHFFVMEYVQGASLEQLSRRKDFFPLPPLVAAALVCQAAQGLAAAHDAGVVHRDIKPDNLVLDSHGLLKITDFGIALVRDGTSLTRTGEMVGSPGFMAPEQVQGDRIDFRADLFSLGAVFYYLLTGKYPFEASNVHSVLWKICSEPHIPVINCRPGCPPELTRIVDRLLEKDASLRGKSAAELGASLKEALSSQGIPDLHGFTSKHFQLHLSENRGKGTEKTRNSSVASKISTEISAPSRRMRVMTGKVDTGPATSSSNSFSISGKRKRSPSVKLGTNGKASLRYLGTWLFILLSIGLGIWVFESKAASIYQSISRSIFGSIYTSVHSAYERIWVPEQGAPMVFNKLVQNVQSVLAWRAKSKKPGGNETLNIPMPPEKDRQAASEAFLEPFYPAESKGGLSDFRADRKGWVHFRHGQGRVQIAYRGSPGLPEGPYREWYASGKAKAEGAFHQGKMEGPWTFWDEEGRKIEIRYRQGQALGPIF